VTHDEYRTALDELFRRRRFGLRPGLETTRALLARLDHPERNFPAIHVTGSKGKGSTAVMAQSILTAHGLRTGLFTSPHLVTYRERARVDGRTIPRSAVVDGLRRIDAAAREADQLGSAVSVAVARRDARRARATRRRPAGVPAPRMNTSTTARTSGSRRSSRMR